MDRGKGIDVKIDTYGCSLRDQDVVNLRFVLQKEKNSSLTVIIITMTVVMYLVRTLSSFIECPIYVSVHEITNRGSS